MKRKVFEEIITAEFRWPTAGDQAFVVAADPLDNANIADEHLPSEADDMRVSSEGRILGCLAAVQAS